MCINREEAAKTDLNIYDAICMGPGIGTEEDAMALLFRVLNDYRGPLVLDADGINCLCKYNGFEEARKRDGVTVFTPHPGEAGRMLHALDLGTYKELGREKTAEELAKGTGSIVLLKGATTLIAEGDADGIELYENPTGNPGMATGGSGRLSPWQPEGKVSGE